MKRSGIDRFLTGARFALLEQLMNRTALFLLVVFIPLWDALYWTMVPHAPLAFRFRTEDTFLRVAGDDLALLTAGLNGLTLIVGFMFFASARRNSLFDRRLTQSGYPQPMLILTKLSSLLVVAVCLSLYTTGMLCFFWRPDSFSLVWLGFFSSALGYGTFGLLLGVLVRGELEGFFLIIMVSLIDTAMQNPFGNPMANQDFLVWLPTYAPMQICVAGAFAREFPWRCLPVALAWPFAFAFLGLAVFHRKTRTGHIRAFLH